MYFLLNFNLAHLKKNKNIEMVQNTNQKTEEELSDCYSFEELSSIAKYEASSTRKGYGIMNICNCSENSYWQSNGTLPHVIDISFPQIVLISKISMFVDYNKDDSYTPSSAILLLGFDTSDLIQSGFAKFNKHTGWIHIYSNDESPPTIAMHVRIVITCNHHDGLDSRIRCLNIFGNTNVQKYKL